MVTFFYFSKLNLKFIALANSHIIIKFDKINLNLEKIRKNLLKYIFKTFFKKLKLIYNSNFSITLGRSNQFDKKNN